MKPKQLSNILLLAAAITCAGAAYLSVARPGKAQGEIGITCQPYCGGATTCSTLPTDPTTSVLSEPYPHHQCVPFGAQVCPNEVVLCAVVTDYFSIDGNGQPDCSGTVTNTYNQYDGIACSGTP